jgi:HD-like signal output (HDOD) protein
MSSARELIGQVKSLPSLPAVYFRVRSIIEDPDSCATDAAKEISCDPALTTRLLHIANSAFYGACGKVESVTDALAILGMNQIHHLVLATSVTMAFAGVSPPLMNMQKFWRTSLYRALVARCMGKSSRHVAGERSFVEGLLGDIGHLVMYLQLPDAAESALQRSLESERPLHLIERELIGFDYAEVGAELVAAWNLAPSIEATIRHHAEPAQAGGWKAEASILHIATVFADTAFKFEPPETWTPRVEPMIWEHAGVCAEQIADFKQQADSELEALAQAILPGFCAISRKAPRRTARVYRLH